MKKPNVTDDFNLRNTLMSVGLTLIDSGSNIRDYIHCLTFKKELKLYEEALGESRFSISVGIDFCRDVNDIVVIHAIETYDLLQNFIAEFCAENGTYRDEVLLSDIANREILRFGPIQGRKRMDELNYDETAVIYYQMLKNIIKSLYYNCCAITLETYQIPWQVKTNIYYTVNTNFRFLNHYHYDVAKLVGLIKELQYRVVSMEAILGK